MDYVQESLLKGTKEESTASDSLITFDIDDASRDLLLESILAMLAVKGIGVKTLYSMFDRNHLHHIFDWDLNTFLSHSKTILSNQRTDLIKIFFQNRQQFREIGCKSAEEIRSQDLVFIPRGHQSYPKSFLRLPEPPRWFFAKGNIEVIHSRAIVGVVGTRTASATGLKLAYRFAKELTNRNLIVLSGMAKGIDEQAHRGAIENYGQTIAILGHGLNTSLSYSNQALMTRIIEIEGVIISEYMPLEQPSRNRYLRRNELQAALSDFIVPVECPDMKSGTGATIRRAKKINTEVIGIVPTNLTDESLIATKNNLEQLKCEVFQVMSQHSKELWEYLQQKMPGHDWSENPQPRQERFFKIIEDQISIARKPLSLDSRSIDRLAKRLKSKVKDS